MFPIGEDRYAVATSVVREVVIDPLPTRLPTAPATVLGAFNLRGEVVPMFDTAELLGIGRVVGTPAAVVINTTAGPAALVVSDLPRFVVLDSEVGPSELRGTAGIFSVDGDVVVMLDVEAILELRVSTNGLALADASTTQ